MARSAKKPSAGSENEAEERQGGKADKRRGDGEKAAATRGGETRERLRRLAYKNGLLSVAPASTSTPLPPSKAALKNDGRDVVKKGARKNRFLFALPGLLAPLSGGKIGELADLHTKNPVLYIDFPQGRMKLFGTIIYPQNKYLTLQLAKTSKNILCEDWFENMVVFSDAWWIGTKEKNPDELKLDFPEELQEGKHVDYDFKGGVGATKEQTCMDKSASEHVVVSPKAKIPDDASEDSGPSNAKTLDDAMELTPIRQSVRTAGKKIKYADSPSGDEDIDNDSSMEVAESNGVSNVKKLDQQKKDDSTSDGEDAPERTQNLHSAKSQKLPATAERSKGSSKRKRGLVQPTISTLFEKMDTKKSRESIIKSPASKGSNLKVQSVNSKKTASHVEVKGSRNNQSRSRKTGTKTLGKQKHSKAFGDEEPDVDVEEISSDSEVSEEE